MHSIRSQGNQQPKPIIVPLVRPLISTLVGVAFFIIPASLVSFFSIGWIFIGPEPNAFITWIESASLIEWVFVIVIILILIPSVLLKLLYPLIVRRIAYGRLTVDSAGLTIETDHERASIYWDKPLQARSWGSSTTGGIDHFINFYEVWELTQDEAQVHLSQAVSYWRWRTLPTPPDSMRGKFGLLIHRKALKAILMNAKVHPKEGVGSTMV